MCPLALQPYNSNPADDRSTEVSTVRGYILFVFAIALGLALAWRLRQVLELVYVSALFAVVLMPLVQKIMCLRIGKWSPSRPIAIVTLVFSVFLILTLFLVFALPPVMHDIQRFATDLPARIPAVIARIKHLPLADKFGVDSLAQKSEGALSSIAQYLFATAPLWLARIFDLFTALILCIYFMLEGEFVYFYFLSFFTDGSRDRLAKTLVVAEVRMSSWFVGQVALMVILGLCSTAVFGLLRVRYFFLLGVLMGLFNIIPVVGGIITIVLAAAVAATDSWTKMAGVLIFYVIYAQVENVFLTPRIMRSRVNMMGLSVIVALLAGTALAGVVGALVAIPTAAMVAVLIDEYFIQKDAAEAAQAAAQAANVAYTESVAAASAAHAEASAASAADSAAQAAQSAEKASS
ncbi:MAG TPA: AI-2E family transporter [Acidobacteriaceae bacterium]|nr:AI-2E family transporter [Acidobacteriaceae bacterium]